MKKLLSILAAVGLVATASSSVVSCTKKESLPTFHDVSDIHGSFLADNQVLSMTDLEPGKEQNSVFTGEAKNHIIATVANMFKNPLGLLSAEDLSVVYNGATSIIDKGDEIIASVTIKQGKENNIVSSNNILVKFVTEPTYFEMDKAKQLDVDLVNSNSYVVSTILNEAQKLASVDPKDIDTWISIEKEGQALMSMDYKLFNDLAQAQNNVLPGFDANNNGMRFDSVGQQIMASYTPETNKNDLIKDNFSKLRTLMSDVNEQLLNKMKEMISKGSIDPNWIRTKDVTDTLKMLNWGNKPFFNMVTE